MANRSPTAAPPMPMAEAVARSGLVDGLVLHRAVTHVDNLRPASLDTHNRLLAEHLIDLGVLNAWQVDQLRLGRTKFHLGPYRILDSIGRGGMGHVFKGEHELLGRVEAIKVLPTQKSTPEAITSFRHEMRAQAALDHPHLVRVSYADRDGETYFLVTEFVPGIDLRRLIRRRGPLTEVQAAWAISQAAEAIDHAHRRGVVHRDVKPGNLLVTPDAVVKVTDLGLAWSLDAGMKSVDAFNGKRVAGTSDYLAPEAIRNPGRVRPEGDVYGLGCTLYYAVTGKVPYPGGSHADKLRRRLREEPRDAESLVPGLSPQMASLIRTAMASRVEERLASAGEMATALSLLASDSGRTGLMQVVNELVAPRAGDTDTKPDWGKNPTGELPETVGLSLEGLPLSPGSTPERRRPASPDWLVRVVAGAALLATAVIAASAAWRAFFA